VTTRKLAMLLAASAAAVLVVMVAVTLATGATQEAHEWYAAPADYAKSLLAHPGALRLVFGLDVAFLVLYTAFFTALADYLQQLGRPFTRVALAMMFGTAILDVVEDHHILSMLDMAEHDRSIGDVEIALQQVISATKFSISYLSLVLFGLAVPRTTKLGLVLALFLIVGNLATGIASYAVPPAMREQIDSGRWIGFLAGFGLAIAWLRSMREGVVDRDRAAGATS